MPIALNESSIAADQRDKADRLWNFSLYLHTCSSLELGHRQVTQVWPFCDKS